MWAYADTYVKVEFEGQSYTLLTKDRQYESEEARKWCLKYWNWHRKEFGSETTEQVVRDLFRFRCFQCQAPVSTVIIPKSDRDSDGNPITFKRTPHFKCKENNCYGGGKSTAATEEYNVITNKSVIPVSELRLPPEEDGAKKTSTPTPNTDQGSTPSKKNRSEKKTSTSIAPLCEQFYTYFLNSELTQKFISIPFISKEAELSYSYLFVDINTPEKNTGQKTGIFYGSPSHYAECRDAYLLIFKSSSSKKLLFIKMIKSDSTKLSIEGAFKGKLFFVLGHLAKSEGSVTISCESSFWCHALKLPRSDNNFEINHTNDVTQSLRSESQDVDSVIDQIVTAINKPSNPPQDVSVPPVEPAEVSSSTAIKSDTDKSESNKGTTEPAKKTSTDKKLSPASKKPKNKLQLVFDKVKRWFRF